MEDTILEIVPDENKLFIIIIPPTPKLRGHIGFGLAVPIRPFVTLFDAYNACKSFEIS